MFLSIIRLFCGGKTANLSDAAHSVAEPADQQVDSPLTQAEIYKKQGNLFLAQGDSGHAEECYRKSISADPDYADAYNNLGSVLHDQGRMDEAISCYRQALSIKPGYAEVYSNLGNALKDQGRLDEAISCYRQALSIKPDYAGVHNNLGNALKEQGRLNEAIASYQQALLLRPDFADVYSNLLFLYAYHALLDHQEYLFRAKGWEQACLTAQERQAAHARTFERLLPGKRLKVGYVSGDFRRHAVSYFVEQLFIHHDRTRIELFAYSNSSKRDAVTERLQALVEHWVPVAGIHDATVRDRIEAEGIDVLIDLSGHTAFNRLGVFARRAAPVQAYYLGYFASTGLTEMDYLIGDEILTPSETDCHFSEQVWRLPRISWSYNGKDAPLPCWQPAPDNIVWVGSFNQLGKLTPATIALWARVLHALPEGRLLLKTQELADAGIRQGILDAMASHGIPMNRIELQDGSITPDWPAHMAYYNRLDIALDPVGAMGGVTTTCDALWMGVPIISMQGDRVTSRASSAMLNAIGYPEWVARSEDEYIEKVVALARDVDQRKALRPIQRDRMAHSPLCDARGLAKDLEDACFEMFGRWANGKSKPFCLPSATRVELLTKQAE